MNTQRVTMEDFDRLVMQFRQYAETFHLEIMSRLRLGLNKIEQGESFCPMEIRNISYLADGIRGEIYCRHDKRTYEISLKVLSEPLLKNEELPSQQQGENPWD